MNISFAIEVEIICGAHMNISFAIEVEMLVLSEKGHIGPPPIMLTIEPRIVIIFRAPSPLVLNQTSYW